MRFYPHRATGTRRAGRFYQRFIQSFLIADSAVLFRPF
jgi:hypothetical protein